MTYQIKDSDDLAAKLKDAGDHLVVIDFFAKWCGPCKMIAPRIEEMVNEYPDVVFLKVDVDECEQIATDYDISSMPTFVFVKNSAKVSTVLKHLQGTIKVDSFSGANTDKLRETLLKYK